MLKSVDDRLGKNKEKAAKLLLKLSLSTPK